MSRRLARRSEPDKVYSPIAQVLIYATQVVHGADTAHTQRRRSRSLLCRRLCQHGCRCLGAVLGVQPLPPAGRGWLRQSS